MMKAATKTAAPATRTTAGSASITRARMPKPSATMRAARPPHLSPALDAVAERLPFADASFDASMATFTVHQWSDVTAGLAEMRRVTRGPALVLTCDPDRCDRLTNELSRDLENGDWDARYGHFRSQSSFDGSLRPIVGRSAERPA